MAAVETGMLGAIGNTPIARVERLAGPGLAEIWIKLEAANPTGSYKDRMALAMIRGAERSGRLQPGQTVVEYTSGSTGSSLAFVCALTGHPLRIVTSNAFAEEKLRTMEIFGADLEIIDSPEGITPTLIPRLRARVDEIVRDEGGYPTDQFRNRDVIVGFEAMGDEIAVQLDQPIDAFVSYVGTSGCFLGSTRALRRVHPALHRVVVEPAESAVISGRPPGTHRIEGGGAGFVPDHLTPDTWDEVVTVPTDDAFAMARRAAVEEGIWSGPSTGANLVAATALASRLGPGRRVVTVQVDSGMKYLNGAVYRS